MSLASKLMLHQKLISIRSAKIKSDSGGLRSPGCSAASVTSAPIATDATQQRKVSNMEADNYEMTQSEIAAATNEWIRRFINEPERFRCDFETVRKFERDQVSYLGKEPTYGSVFAAYLLKLHQELNAA